ncbi:MAG: hypothetical protein K2Y23_16560 [Cyanobacteria bacterium]|nr:hypothetical protein [Cyanobacteriota bacterium]
MARHEVTTRRVLYEIPGMKSVNVEKSTFPGANGEPLPLEIYLPIDPIGDCVVAMVEGYPSSGFEKHMGCTFMEMEWTISMARLIAASGMTAVTHSNREAQPDALALMKHLGATYRKVGLWATSGHGPLALVAASHATCAVLNNPMTKDFCPDTPLFIIRAGKDETPGLNVDLDAFVARALAENKPITLVNYPEAPHSYELSRDTPETRQVLRQGLDFLRAHLL